MRNKQDLLSLLGGGACLLVACSVDTSDITWRPDAEFDRDNLGGVTSGGVLNRGGTKGQAGSDVVGDGGEGDSGGKGGTSAGGADVGGKPGAGAGGIAPGGSSNGGTGGTGVSNGYPCKNKVVPDKLIADFTSVPNAMSKWQNPTKTLTFGLYTYPPDAAGPTLTLMGGELTGSAKVDRPSGFGIKFSGCADASAAGFKGISFQLSGMRGDAQPFVVRAGLGINDTTFADAGLQLGGCVPPMGQDGGYCRVAASEIMLAGDMPSPMVVNIPFDNFRMGNPAATVDPSQITSVEWGFIYLIQDGAYSASVTVDNVSFN